MQVGYDKHLDYKPLAKPILDNVKTLILMGQTAEKIFIAVKEEAEKENKQIDTYMCETLEETVKLAKKFASPRRCSAIFSCKCKF